MELSVQNIVAKVDLSGPIDMTVVTQAFPTAYHPEDFPGVILHLDVQESGGSDGHVVKGRRRMRGNGRTLTFLIFASGRMVCVGAKSKAELQDGIRRLVSKLHSLDALRVTEAEYSVQNIVVTSRIGASVDLESAAMLVENSIYEPEQFPGVVLRLVEPRATFLIFGNGKVVCTGAADEEKIREAIRKLGEKLADAGVITMAA